MSDKTWLRTKRPKAPTHIGQDRVQQDKKIYKHLIQNLKEQLNKHDRAAAARRSETLPADSQALATNNKQFEDLTSKLGLHSITAESPCQGTKIVALHNFPGADKAMTTRELLENIISVMAGEDILEARLVNTSV